jgi:hypothetical protein
MFGRCTRAAEIENRVPEKSRLTVVSLKQTSTASSNRQIHHHAQPKAQRKTKRGLFTKQHDKPEQYRENVWTAIRPMQAHPLEKPSTLSRCHGKPPHTIFA